MEHIIICVFSHSSRLGKNHVLLLKLHTRPKCDRNTYAIFEMKVWTTLHSQNKWFRVSTLEEQKEQELSSALPIICKKIGGYDPWYQMKVERLNICVLSSNAYIQHSSRVEMANVPNPLLFQFCLWFLVLSLKAGDIFFIYQPWYSSISLNYIYFMGNERVFNAWFIIWLLDYTWKTSDKRGITKKCHSNPVPGF